MKKGIASRISYGALIVIIGLAWLLQNLGVTAFGYSLQTFWPLILVAAGLIAILGNVRNYLWPLILIVVGLVIQLDMLELTQASFWQIAWPLIVVIIGISIIVRRSTRDGFGEKIVTTDAREDITAVFSGSDQQNHSADYKGGKLTAVMGGAKLDLRKVIIKKEATIEVFVLCGGIELVVPEHVLVRVGTSNILGGTESKVIAPTKKDAPTLTIVGDVILGGIEIKN